MLTVEQLAGFLAAAVIITASPGPDNLMVLSMGMSQGRKRGIAFGLGCALGCLSHTALAVIGVSALIAASPPAFLGLKIAGGLYLVWLGAGILRSRSRITVQALDDDGQCLLALFFKGVLANALNPKVVLFFLSFLPQFIVPANGHVTVQTLALGMLFTVQAAILFSLLAVFSGAVGQWLSARRHAARLLDCLAGMVLVVLGLRLLVFH